VFEAHDAVNIVDAAGAELARALVNYGSDDLRRIAGKRSKDVEAVLGYPGTEAAADRDNIVIFKRAAGPAAPVARASPRDDRDAATVSGRGGGDGTAVAAVSASAAASR